MNFSNKGNKLGLYCTHMQVIKWNSLEKLTDSWFCGIQSFTIGSQDTIFGTHLESDESSIHAHNLRRDCPH